MEVGLRLNIRDLRSISVDQLPSLIQKELDQMVRHWMFKTYIRQQCIQLHVDDILSSPKRNID